MWIEPRVCYLPRNNFKTSDSLEWRTIVRSMPKDKEVSIWAQQSIPKEDLPFNSQTHSGGIGVMSWGGFSFLGLGPLVPIEESQKYIQFCQSYKKPDHNTGLIWCLCRIMLLATSRIGHCNCRYSHLGVQLYVQYTVDLFNCTYSKP